jgi:hypothetical protein
MQGLGGAGGSEPAACDYTQDQTSGAINGFTCYSPPNDATICQACDPTLAAPPFCGPGLTCYPDNAAGTTGACAKYCCTNADCGSGMCLTSSMGAPIFAVAPMLGICILAGSSSPGDGGTGDGGTGDGGTDDGGTGDGGTSDGGTGGGGTDGGGTDGGGMGPFACDVPATPPSMGSCVTVGM